MRLQENDTIFHNWKIKKIIGEGSFGTVYEIEREEFGRTYKAAAKVISIPKNQSDYMDIMDEGMTEENVTEYYRSLVDDIIGECDLMERMKGDSHIVSYEDHHVAMTADGMQWTIYIRMELLKPLVAYTKENSLTQKDVIQLGIDICRGLETCQKFKVIHRDIKPENIFISDAHNYKLGDFGISKVMGRSEMAVSKKGTQVYMAPEVYRGEQYDTTVDIYSLGIVLFRLMNNNRTPFLPPYPAPIRFKDKEAALQKRLTGEPIPKPCNASQKFAEVIQKACSFQAKDRYQKPHEMRKVLEALLEEDLDDSILIEEIVNGNSQFEKTGTVGGSKGRSILVKEEAQRRAEEERKRLEEEARRKAEEEERKRQEEEARRKAEEEERKRQEEEARRKAEEEERKRLEEEARRREEEEERKRQEAEAHRKAEEEERRRAEEEARRKAEEEERKRLEEEARRREEEEERKRQEEEAHRKAEEERRRQEEEARRKVEEERRQQEEAARKAAEEARRKAEEEERRRQEEEARRRAEEEERKRLEEEARQKAEEERRQAEEARRKAEKEERKRAEEEARRKAEEERKRQEEEALQKAEEERKKHLQEEARRKEDAEKKRAEAEARQKAIEARQQLEAEKESQANDLERTMQLHSGGQKNNSATNPKIKLRPENAVGSFPVNSSREGAKVQDNFDDFKDLEPIQTGVLKTESNPYVAPAAKKQPVYSAAPKKSSDKKKFIIIFACFAIVVGILCISQTKRVPDVTGMTVEEAKKAFEHAGMQLGDTEYQFSDQAVQGSILSQKKKGGRLAWKNSRQTVVVSDGPKRMEMPDLSNKTLKEAADVLDEMHLGLMVAVRPTYSLTVAPESVCGQEPAAGEEIQKGADVVLCISQGGLAMPDLRGKTKEEAENILAQQGIPVVCEEEYNKDIAAGQVAEQSVEPETPVDAATQIILKISKGVETFSVPNVVGLSQEEAVQKLIEAGYKEKKITVLQEYSGDVAAGFVISQDIAENTQVEKGSKITITVSLGPKPQSSGKPASGGGGSSNNSNDGWIWEEMD
ncbi:MAG: PASTA domain-containing protein [Clostridium sp.]|nr:PASTA domain-containing protein [Clostridium sp.]